MDIDWGRHLWVLVRSHRRDVSEMDATWSFLSIRQKSQRKGLAGRYIKDGRESV